MKYLIIACKIFNKMLTNLKKDLDNIDIIWIEQELHNTPTKLNSELKKTIENIDPEASYDAIILLYGLCSNGVIGLGSTRFPIIVPKTDDCIGIFLGSQNKYLEYFNSMKGIYWYNSSWIADAYTPSQKSLEEKKAEYIEKYGEDNAEFLMEEENNWIKEYENCLFVKEPRFNEEEEIAYTKEAAKFFGWNYVEVLGSQKMLKNIISGNWDDNFLICPINHKIVESFDEHKLKAEKY
jgi:hypothetical protein